MKLDDLVASAIAQIDALSVDELEAAFRRYGYSPVRASSYELDLEKHVVAARFVTFPPPIPQAFNDEECSMNEAA